MNKAQILAKLGLAKEAPVTAEHLSTAFPEVITAIVDQAHAAGVASVDKAAAGKEAVTAVLASVVAMAVAFFGETNGKKFEALIASGVTADQIKSLGIVPEQPKETDAEIKAKADLLAAIKAAGAGNPGAGAGTAAAKDFTALVEAYQTEHKCSRIDAIRATANAHPDVHQAYIKLVNAKKK